MKDDLSLLLQKEILELSVNTGNIHPVQQACCVGSGTTKDVGRCVLEVESLMFEEKKIPEPGIETLV